MTALCQSNWSAAPDGGALDRSAAPDGGALGHAGPAPLALDAHVVRAAIPGGQDRLAEQRVELGVQRGALRDPEVRAELEPPLADRGAELDHDLGLTREAGQHILELGQDRSGERCSVEPEAKRARQ